MPVAAQVTIKGKVQGVYFRLGTREEAQALGVTGWVRNRADGQVEMLAQGERQAVEDLIAWCRQGPPQARVDEVLVRWREYEGGGTGFEVR